MESPTVLRRRVFMSCQAGVSSRCAGNSGRLLTAESRSIREGPATSGRVGEYNSAAQLCDPVCVSVGAKREKKLRGLLHHRPDATCGGGGRFNSACVYCDADSG